MINPKKVQEIIKGSLMNHGDMLVGAVRTYELSMGHLEEQQIQRHIKEEISHNMAHALVGKSFIEHTKDDMDKSDVFTGRVLVIPYLEMEQMVASITAKVIQELHNGNDLVLPEINWL